MSEEDEIEEDVSFLFDLLKVAHGKAISNGIVKLVEALHRAGIPIQKMSFAKSRMAPIYEVLSFCAEKRHLTWEEYEDIMYVRGWNPENAKRILQAFERKGLIKLDDNGIRWVEKK